MQGQSEKAPNDIRIGMNSRPRYVIKYATSILKEKNLKELKFSAVGGSIGKLLDTVEVLKVMIPGLYQQNKITSVAYQTVDSNKSVINQRLYPKMEVVLSTEEPKTKNEGTQDKMDEKLRAVIQKSMDSRKEEREKQRGSSPRGGYRGGRGGPRRGNFRGGRRGAPRGGFRGNRGGPRRGGNFRGGRGAPRRGSPMRGGRNVNRGRGRQ